MGCDFTGNTVLDVVEGDRSEREVCPGTGCDVSRGACGSQTCDATAAGSTDGGDELFPGEPVSQARVSQIVERTQVCCLERCDDRGQGGAGVVRGGRRFQGKCLPLIQTSTFAVRAVGSS